MAVRPIDGNELLKWCEKIIDQACHPVTVQIGEVFRDKVRSMPTLTPPNEWISVEDRLPEPGERVLATDCGFVGEFYINKRGKWQRYNVNCSELLMALDILYWMPLPEMPKEDE